MMTLTQLAALRPALASWNAANKRARDEYTRHPIAFRRPTIAWPLDPRHGTHAGWKAHGREGVEECGPCRDFGRAYQAGQRRRQRLARRPDRGS